MSFEGVSKVLQGRFQYLLLYTLLQRVLFCLFQEGQNFFNNLIETGFKYASREIFNVFQGCLRVL